MMKFYHPAREDSIRVQEYTSTRERKRTKEPKKIATISRRAKNCWTK
jgi:hypothetical protein